MSLYDCQDNHAQDQSSAVLHEQAMQECMKLICHDCAFTQVTKQGPFLPRYVYVWSNIPIDSLLHEHSKQWCACNAQKVLRQSRACCNICTASIKSQQYGTEQIGARSNGHKLLPWPELL